MIRLLKLYSISVSSQSRKTCTQSTVHSSNRYLKKKNLRSISMLGDSLPTGSGCHFRSSYVSTLYQRTSAKLQKNNRVQIIFSFFKNQNLFCSKETLFQLDEGGEEAQVGINCASELHLRMSISFHTSNAFYRTQVKS